MNVEWKTAGATIGVRSETTRDLKMKLNTIPEVIDDIKQGKMIIVVDDE